jgi:hypothetical protein
MIEKDLSDLQVLVDGLIGSHSRFVAENAELRKKLVALRQKKEEAFKRLASILMQVKELGMV